MHVNTNLLLNLFFVALALESLQRLSAVALLSLTLLLKDLDGLVEGLDGRALHLQLLSETETEKHTVTFHLMIYCVLFSPLAAGISHMSRPITVYVKALVDTLTYLNI